MSDYPPNLATAVAVLQTKLPEVRKSSRADVETKTGGTYSYTYADLSNISSQILPLLGELGLSFICKPTFTDGRFVLAYSLLHVSGDRENGEYPLPTGGTPQAIGSAITYGRRYTLCAVTGLAPEDDDDAATAQAETASTRGTAQRASGQRRPPQRPPTSGRGTAQRGSSRPPLPGEPEGITAPQRAKVMAVFGQLDIADRAERLRLSSVVVNRTLASANDLTKEEARTLIDTLERAVQQDDPRDYLDGLTALPIDGDSDEPTLDGA
jgi:hypothetical protein